LDDRLRPRRVRPAAIASRATARGDLAGGRWSGLGGSCGPSCSRGRSRSGRGAHGETDGLALLARTRRRRATNRLGTRGRTCSGRACRTLGWWIRRLGRPGFGLRRGRGGFRRLGLHGGTACALAPLWGLCVHRLRGEHCSENASPCQGAKRPNSAPNGPKTAGLGSILDARERAVPLGADRTVGHRTPVTTGRDRMGVGAGGGGERRFHDGVIRCDGDGTTRRRDRRGPSWRATDDHGLERGEACSVPHRGARGRGRRMSMKERRPPS